MKLALQYIAVLCTVVTTVHKKLFPYSEIPVYNSNNYALLHIGYKVVPQRIEWNNRRFQVQLLKCFSIIIIAILFLNNSFAQVSNKPTTSGTAKPTNTAPTTKPVTTSPTKPTTTGLSSMPTMAGQNPMQEVNPNALAGMEMYYRASQMGEVEIFLTKYFGCNAVITDSTEKVTVQESVANMITAQPLLKMISISDEQKLLNISCPGFKDGCVKKVTYSGKVRVMNPMMGGYDVTLGYCCWDINPNMVNIQGLMQAKNQGLSMTLHIPEMSPIDTNTSPIFQYPPVIITCKDQLISFSSAAKDNDRDSLVYAFGNIDDYLSVNGNPNPDAPKVYPAQPVNKTFAGGRPPFKKVEYQKDFSYEKPMKGNQIFIDSKTGEVNLKATTIGDYLIGISVKEFRNKKLLGTYQKVIKIKVVS